MAFSNIVVARAAAGIWGLKLGYATTNLVLTQANATGGSLAAIINSAFNDSYPVTTPTSTLADMVVANLGLTGAAATNGKAYILQQLATVPAANRGAALDTIIDQFSTLGSDPVYGAAATAFNAKVAAAAAYSGLPNSQDAVLGNLPSATSFNLTLGQDNITATAGNDTFTAYIFDNSNSLQSGDFLDGGLGVDTLFADMGSSANFAVTPITRSIETIQIRAQSRATDTGDNNVAGEARVDVDFERVNGVTRIESNNSRADLIVEDVRILPTQITKDITIAFVQSDPGNVDFGVYFDQASLTANRTSSSVLTLQVLDTKSQVAGLDPLLQLPYDGVSFSLNGTLVVLQDATINNATTYAQLLTAIQGRLAANPLTAGIVTAALGPTFTAIDADTGITATGTSIVLSATGAVFGIGNYLASQGVPANSTFYTNQIAGATTTEDLVTSTVVLDDVGRGSNGGDLVIGGLSVGETSTSRGVDRFEITVERTSRLQNVDSTNNFLKEVTFKNGATNGNVTVLGNFAGGGIVSAGGTQGGPDQNAPLPGAVAQHDEFGFNDVRLIDASAMVGSVTFDAVVTSLSFDKYIKLTDTDPLPGADNTSVPSKTTQVADFIYSGGAGNDSISVQIDPTIAASNSNILVGREDFTFRVNGNAGNDALTVRIVQNDELGSLQNWYGHQKALRNITIDGGAGDDTIRKPGAGDAIILGGDGNDTIYADNTGAQNAGAVPILTGGTGSSSYTNFNPYTNTNVNSAGTGTTVVPNGQNAIWTFNTDNSATNGVTALTAREISDLKSDANNAYNLYKASVTVTFKGITKTLPLPSSTFTPTDLFINQRIKEDINSDPVLSKLLLAVDGPGYSLEVKSLIDGVMAAGDLTVTITPANAVEFSTTELAAVAAAYSLPVGSTAADVQAIFTTALGTFNTNADYGATSVLVAGVSSTATADFGRNAGTDIVGADSTATSDNTITPGAGNDVIVLGTDKTIVGVTTPVNLEASNDVIVYGLAFGNDTIVNFQVAGPGIDQFNFAGLGGRAAGGLVNGVAVAGKATALAANTSIVIDELITTAGGNSTPADVAAYFTDSANATVLTHTVIVVNTTTNIATVYAVTDAIGDGGATPNITAVLAGTIDLADTLWQNVVVGNFT